MDKKTLVICIVIATILITTLLQIMMSGRQVSPAGKRGLWATVVAGIVALALMVLYSLTR